MQTTPTAPDHSVQLTPTDTDSLLTSIITAVTQATGSDPDTPLYDVIDPDALTDLYERSSPTVDFEYAGSHVTIHPDQTITVTDHSA